MLFRNCLETVQKLFRNCTRWLELLGMGLGAGVVNVGCGSSYGQNLLAKLTKTLKSLKNIKKL